VVDCVPVLENPEQLRGLLVGLLEPPGGLWELSEELLEASAYVKALLDNIAPPEPTAGAALLAVELEPGEALEAVDELEDELEEDVDVEEELDELLEELLEPPPEEPAPPPPPEDPLPCVLQHACQS
jgi:hypothetical protein